MKSQKIALRQRRLRLKQIRNFIYYNKKALKAFQIYILKINYNINLIMPKKYLRGHKLKKK